MEVVVVETQSLLIRCICWNITIFQINPDLYPIEVIRTTSKFSSTKRQARPKAQERTS